ncbi:Threonine synthase [uncultured archaeon]|nr:Threonine synthase [uncultured archaeon]
MRYDLVCMNCGSVYDSSYDAQVCGTCGGILEVAYSGRMPKVKGTGKFWDYERLLPDCAYRHYELGSTRLIRSHKHSNVFLKLEIDNPTRSFKDRGSVVEVGKAVEAGKAEIALASTGNMAYSVAYYAKLAGLRVRVFMGKGANKDKVRDIRGEHDAVMDFVNGDFTKAQALATRYAKKTGAFLAGDYCYRKEGQKTVAYEVMDQLPETTHIVVPVGNATLISGVFKGLREMKAAGSIKHMPKIIGVQATGSAPLIKAFKLNKSVEYVLPRTAADAIAVGFPTFGDQAILALKETGGSTVAVSDAEMASEQRAFFNEYGMVAELAGVASLAALKKLKFASRDKAVCVISGGNV